MPFIPSGKHLVAGEWPDGVGTFASSPAKGPAHHFAVGTEQLVNRAREAAEQLFAAPLHPDTQAFLASVR